MSGNIWHEHVDATWHSRGVTHGMIHVVHLCEWLTMSHVSKEGNKRKRKKYEDDKWQRRKVVGSFPHFDQFGYENQKGEGGKEKREKWEEETDREREERGRKEKGDFSGHLTVESRWSEN